MTVASCVVIHQFIIVIELVVQLIAGGCDVVALAIDGMAAIHRAVITNQLESIRALILSTSNLNVQDNNGDSPVHVCIYKYIVSNSKIFFNYSWLCLKIFCQY